ncbi:hypothetical protein NL676_029722 [Syzygium grande]|nr:hypothetical protein NL676_029722 [Syzygium grande]
MERLQSELRGEIDGKRYLLVLDDVWNVERETWLSLKTLLLGDKALAKNGCELGELKELNNIRGSLCIENLESVTDAIADSRAANLIGKHSLESLKLEWGDSDTDDSVIGNRDEVLLDGLRPHSNLQKLTIDGYKGESFPRWMMYNLVSSLPKLVEVGFHNCGRCKRLPPLGQLPHLKSLNISGMTKLEYIESDHSSTPTKSFPSLLKLDIYYCEKLEAVPPTPHLEELTLTRAHPALINMMVGLNKLKIMEIWIMEFLECVPEECWKSLTSLESLHIGACRALTSLSKAEAAAPPPPLGTRHQSNQVDLDSSDSEELDLSNHDESSGGNNLILELHSLRSVDLSYLPKLASLPRWLLQASNLEVLSIHICDELDICKDESGDLIILDSHGGLHHSLRSVTLFDLPKLASLPRWLLQASNLERLRIIRCYNLKELPEQIEALQSLQRLHIDECPSLTSLPEGMGRLASLTQLRISGCGELESFEDESGNNNNILDSHGGLHGLRSVDLYSLPKIASLPQWLLQASNLERLEIKNCSNLKELPEQIEALQSLRQLRIFYCPR